MREYIRAFRKTLEGGFNVPFCRAVMGKLVRKGFKRQIPPENLASQVHDLYMADVIFAH